MRLRPHPARIGRRRLLWRTGALILVAESFTWHGRAVVNATPVTLRTAPLEIGGDWGGSLPGAAEQVISRMRSVCLANVALVSDRQPDALRIDDHASGPPAIWLHDEPSATAWIIVDIGSRDWCKLAYQFGHELGHVLCNSWQRKAKPQPPCQWVEESLVEAFSIRGLGLLAASWEADPPFPGDAGFAKPIRDYRQNVIDKYAAAAAASASLATWFHANRQTLDQRAGLNPAEAPMILGLVGEYDADHAVLADLGALNRWPERSALPLEEYLSRWQKSCGEIGAPGRLPKWLRGQLNLS